MNNVNHKGEFFMSNTNHISKYDLFFDESRYKSSSNLEVNLMGSFIVPDILYNKEQITKLNQELQQNKFKLHFTDFQQRSNSIYKKVLQEFLKRPELVKFNFISFEKEGNYLENHIAFSKKNMLDMVYSKLPERTIYGGIRNVSRFTPAVYSVYIESSYQYIALDLNNKIKQQLNSQALYRNDSFTIEQSNLYSKNQQIGIEITDMLLGIFSLIIRNPSKYNSDGKISKIRKAKLKFIYKQKNLLESFCKSVTYYELDENGSLNKREFSRFLHEFIMKYESENKQGQSV